MYINGTVLKIKCFSTFYCIGFDAKKVSKGIEDLTSLRDLQPDKNWKKGIKASKKMYYAATKTNRKEVERMANQLGIPLID